MLVVRGDEVISGLYLDQVAVACTGHRDARFICGVTEAVRSVSLDVPFSFAGGGVTAVAVSWVMRVVVVVVVVLALIHRYNAVRGHRTGSNNSGAEDDLRRKTM